MHLERHYGNPALLSWIDLRKLNAVPLIRGLLPQQSDCAYAIADDGIYPSLKLRLDIMIRVSRFFFRQQRSDLL